MTTWRRDYGGRWGQTDVGIETADRVGGGAGVAGGTQVVVAC